MNLGTPGFVGERIRQAREARGLTATSLAELLSITRASISLYECGKCSPQPELLARIADKLSLPMTYFTLPISKTKTRPVFFRSMVAATKTDRNRGNSRVEWFGEIIYPYLTQYISFPAVNLPPSVTIDNAMNLSDDDIENFALATRKYWGIGNGPISNVLLLFENNGILTVRMNLQADTLDAFSNVYDSIPLLFLGTGKDSAVRLRFDAAHELGHLILHRNITQTQLNNLQLFKLMEDQANRFAGAFLVPSDSFASDYFLPTLNSFITMKSKWLVSICVIIKRAAHLQFIDKEQEQKLWVSYSRKGWRKREPMDERIVVENPVLISRAINLIIKEGIKTKDEIASELPLSPIDIEELMNLPYGYMGPSSPDVRLNDREPILDEDDYRDAIHQAEQILKQQDSWS